MAEHVIVAGEASGPVLVLDPPISFWGGFDPATGRVIDRRHPQVGECLTGAILAMASGRGSSSGSNGLAEAIRRGTAPAAIVMLERDEIVAIGALVADELYGTIMPIVVVDDERFDELSRAVTASIDAEGHLSVE